MLNNPLLRGGIVLLAGAGVFVGVYCSGERHGTNSQLLKQQALQQQWDQQIQEAQQAYIAQLQAAQSEKEKWQAFAQRQSADLAKAAQERDAARELIKKDISRAIKDDEKGGSVYYSGLGADSLRLYGKALGYTDSDR